MTDLAKLVVKLEAQTAQFNKEMSAISGRMKKFESTTNAVLKGVAGAFAGFKLVSFGKELVDAADKMNDLSKQTGVAVEDLSRLQYAAEQNGGGVESLAKGLKILAKNAFEAASGGKEQAETFKSLGVSVTDASGKLKPMHELLLESADGFAKLKDGTAKAALAQKAFGKAGLEMIPFLNQGRAGIEALERQADNLGITLSSEAAQSADDFNDSLNKLKGVSTGAARDLLFTLLPALTKIAQALGTLATAGQTVFEGVGKTLGGLAAAGVQALTGNVEGAKAVLRAMDEDAAALSERTKKRMDAIWGDVPQDIKAASEATEDFNMNLVKTDKALAEIVVTAEKISTSPMVKFYEDLNKATQTSLEKQIADLNLFKAQLDELAEHAGLPADVYRARWNEALRSVTSDTETALESQVAQLEDFTARLDEQLNRGIISPEQWRLRMAEAIDEALPVVEVGAKKIGTTLLDEFNKVNEFQLQMARNSVDIISDTLYDGITGGFDKSVKGILDSFGDMMLKLSIQAVSAKIGQKIFGDIAVGGTSSSGGIFDKLFGGSGGGGGFLDSILGKIGGFFGGLMDSGGSAQPGKAYMIGTGAQPEMFVPNSAGKFIPNADKQLGTQRMAPVTQNIYVQGTYNERTGQQIARDASNRQRQASRLS